MQTVEDTYVTALAIPEGTPVDAPKSIRFEQGIEVPCCLQLFVDYTQTVASRTLTITLVIGTLNGDIYEITDNASVDLTETGKFAISVSVGGAPRLMAFNFSSVGAAGADDVVTAKISGLPVGGYQIV